MAEKPVVYSNPLWQNLQPVVIQTNANADEDRELSRRKAKRARLLLHPSFVPPKGKEKDRRLFPICTPTGRFCSKKCIWCDPAFEGITSAFEHYGSGVTAYFKTIKAFTWIFFFLFILSIPALTINTFGGAVRRSTSAFSLSASTLGNLANANSTAINLPLTDYDLPRPLAGFIYAMCDIAGCAVLIFTFLYLKIFERREAKHVERDVVMASDYTVYLPWVLPDTTEDDIRAFIRVLTRSPEFPDGFKIADINLVEDTGDMVATFVERGRLFRKLERLSQKIDELNSRVAHGEQVSGECCGFMGLRSKILRLVKEREALSAKIEVINQRAKQKPTSGVVAAFITFENMDVTEWILNEYPNNGVAWCCQPYAKRFRGKRTIIERAPPPSSVRWENLNIKAVSQFMRQMLTGLLTFLLLAGSFVLLWFASYQQQAFAQSAKSIRCLDADILDGLREGTLNRTSVLSMDAEDPRAYCFCASLDWTDYNKDDILLGSVGELAPQCRAQACLRMFGLDPATTFQLNYCVDWVRARSVAISLSLIATVAVLAINVLLATVMRMLTKFEGHHSIDQLNRSLAWRLFFAQFFNTAVLVVIINASTDRFFKWRYSTGRYSDFTPSWYENVGAALITTALLNIITPHVYNLARATAYAIRIGNKKLKALSQRDMNEAFIGPYADYSLRYAQIYNMIFLCFVFSTGMPLLNVICLVGLVVSYWVDKLLFVRYHRAPPSFSVALSSSMSNLLPIAIILHLGIGLWMISNETIFKNTLDIAGVTQLVSLGTAYLDAATPSLVQRGAKRVTEQQALPMLILFIIMVATSVLRIIFTSFSRAIKNAFHFITCNKCRKIQQISLAALLGAEDDFVPRKPLYSESTDPSNRLEPWAMQGITSYNILENPEIQSVFAIPRNFAATHKRLSDLADFETKDLLKSSRSLGNAGGSALVLGAPAPPPNAALMLVDPDGQPLAEDADALASQLARLTDTQDMLSAIELQLERPDVLNDEEEDDDAAVLEGMGYVTSVSRRQLSLSTLSSKRFQRDTSGLVQPKAATPTEQVSDAELGTVNDPHASGTVAAHAALLVSQTTQKFGMRPEIATMASLVAGLQHFSFANYVDQTNKPLLMSAINHLHQFVIKDYQTDLQRAGIVLPVVAAAPMSPLPNAPGSTASPTSGSEESGGSKELTGNNVILNPLARAKSGRALPTAPASSALPAPAVQVALPASAPVFAVAASSRIVTAKQ